MSRQIDSASPGSVADLSEGGAPLASGDAKPRYATAAPPEKFVAAAKRAVRIGFDVMEAAA